MTCDACSDPECSGPTSDPGDPHWDGTDSAHPAWWRGNDAAVQTLSRHVAEILARPMTVLEPHAGRAQAEYQATREAIATLAINYGCVTAEFEKASATIAQQRDDFRALNELLNIRTREREEARTKAKLAAKLVEDARAEIDRLHHRVADLIAADLKRQRTCTRCGLEYPCECLG